MAMLHGVKAVRIEALRRGPGQWIAHATIDRGDLAPVHLVIEPPPGYPAAAAGADLASICAFPPGGEPFPPSSGLPEAMAVPGASSALSGISGPGYGVTWAPPLTLARSAGCCLGCAGRGRAGCTCAGASAGEGEREKLEAWWAAFRIMIYRAIRYFIADPVTWLAVALRIAVPGLGWVPFLTWNAIQAYRALKPTTAGLPT